MVPDGQVYFGGKKEIDLYDCREPLIAIPVVTGMQQSRSWHPTGLTAGYLSEARSTQSNGVIFSISGAELQLVFVAKCWCNSTLDIEPAS